MRGALAGAPTRRPVSLAWVHKLRMQALILVDRLRTILPSNHWTAEVDTMDDALCAWQRTSVKHVVLQTAPATWERAALCSLQGARQRVGRCVAVSCSNQGTIEVTTTVQSVHAERRPMPALAGGWRGQLCIGCFGPRFDEQQEGHVSCGEQEDDPQW